MSAEYAQYVEQLRNYLPEIGIGITSVAIAFLLRQKIVAKRPDVDPRDLEVHHQKARYLGGGDVEENLVALTRPFHALEHYRLARKSKGRDRYANDWAVKQIVKRMLPHELDEFNDLVSREG